ncbi:hypothetical protein DU490_16770 [Halomonas sp. DQ26W]|uniref:hypothetical protein n=1 Tax=Halomonas sp. DQ26W TaxID=2282311 RepID=UPI000DF7841C|nr:hypothetical protein [Halomonas sp. DQ26W]RDB41756.1 hypothetical protein DU490_16770 [Halomonas sp. DQ26W]
MLNRIRHRLGYLILLVLIMPGLVLTSAGEALAHGSASLAGIEAGHQETVRDGHGHGHVHDHDHAPGDRRHFHYESGNHFHEKADRLGTGIAIESRFRAAPRLSELGGNPLRRVYRLERPPRSVIAG